MTNERFIVETVFPESGGVGSPVIKDTLTGETIPTEEYEITNLLNEMVGETKSKPIYEMTVLELIKNKDQLLFDYMTFMKYYRKKEADLLLNTDFKAEGCTNEKQRTAYVNVKMDVCKMSKQAYENNIDIVNDILRLRMKEVKPE